MNQGAKSKQSEKPWHVWEQEYSTHKNTTMSTTDIGQPTENKLELKYCG